jgi:hypothetical protein
MLVLVLRLAGHGSWVAVAGGGSLACACLSPNGYRVWSILIISSENLCWFSLYIHWFGGPIKMKKPLYNSLWVARQLPFDLPTSPYSVPALVIRHAGQC